MTTQTAILIGLIIYGCLMLAVSLFFMARVKKAADYFVAGRGGVAKQLPRALSRDHAVERRMPSTGQKISGSFVGSPLAGAFRSASKLAGLHRTA